MSLIWPVHPDDLIRDLHHPHCDLWLTATAPCSCMHPEVRLSTAQLLDMIQREPVALDGDVAAS